MESKDKKIDFDLDFLDKNIKEKPKQGGPSSKGPNWIYHKDGPGAQTSKPSAPSSGGMSDSAKKWAWGIGIFIVFIVIGSFSDNNNSSTSSTTPTATNNGMVQVGQYMCSSYNASQADSLAPSSFSKTSLDTQSTELDSLNTDLDSEKSEVENDYFDETDQNSIDVHNEKVDTYNYHLQQYKNKYNSYESAFNSYNTSVDTYNNFLKNNCTPN